LDFPVCSSANKNFKEQTFVIHQSSKRTAFIEHTFLTIEVSFFFNDRLYKKILQCCLLHFYPVCKIHQYLFLENIG